MSTKVPTQKTVGAAEVRDHFGAFLNRIYHGEERVVVEKGGIPVAAIINIREYEQFRRVMAERALRELVRHNGPEAERQGLTEEQLFEELSDTRREVLREKYGDQERQ